MALLPLAGLPLVAPTTKAVTNTADIFNTTGTELSTGADWSLGTVPMVYNDAEFTTASSSGALTLTGSSLTFGSLDDTNTGTAHDDLPTLPRRRLARSRWEERAISATA